MRRVLLHRRVASPDHPSIHPSHPASPLISKHTLTALARPLVLARVKLVSLLAPTRASALPAFPHLPRQMDVDPQPPQEQQQHQSAPMNAAEGAAGTPAANASAALLMGFAGAPASTFPPAAPLAAAPPQQQQQQDPSSLAHLLASGPAHVLAPAPVAPVEPTAAVAAASSHAPSPLPAPTTTPAPSASDASLPPAPTLLPPSHPLAPPPEPFADAQPTVPGTAFDAPSLPPTPGAAPAADTASSAFPPPMNGSASLPPSASATEAQAQPPAAVSLKRDSPDNDEGPTQAGPPLSTPASGGPPAGMGDLLNGSSADEHAAKRAKLEEVRLRRFARSAVYPSCSPVSSAPGEAFDFLPAPTEAGRKADCALFNPWLHPLPRRASSCVRPPPPAIPSLSGSAAPAPPPPPTCSYTAPMSRLRARPRFRAGRPAILATVDACVPSA